MPVRRNIYTQPGPPPAASSAGGWDILEVVSPERRDDRDATSTPIASTLRDVSNKFISSFVTPRRREDGDSHRAREVKREPLTSQRQTSRMVEQEPVAAVEQRDASRLRASSTVGDNTWEVPRTPMRESTLPPPPLRPRRKIYTPTPSEYEQMKCSVLGSEYSEPEQAQDVEQELDAHMFSPTSVGPPLPVLLERPGAPSDSSSDRVPPMWGMDDSQREDSMFWERRQHGYYDGWGRPDGSNKRGPRRTTTILRNVPIEMARTFVMENGKVFVVDAARVVDKVDKGKGVDPDERPLFTRHRRSSPESVVKTMDKGKGVDVDERPLFTRPRPPSPERSQRIVTPNERPPLRGLQRGCAAIQA
ncbi:hypothetical protein EXIGLDRAFT_775697 [Exidia glandulosa HHB12029]|uniref:Uncharacterized protein n=1 Tax=Exidia glandulosa HHB12029 TaxID=1314781 RepID=A0A165DTW4_EXIGL|nr:hypothetical protein EXIGLDRAFT_775697 [Exidia glandulosa HHB12029]